MIMDATEAESQAMRTIVQDKWTHERLQNRDQVMHDLVAENQDYKMRLGVSGRDTCER